MRFGAALQVEWLRTRGFRPFSLALAAQRSGGRRQPLLMQLPLAPPRRCGSRADPPLLTGSPLDWEQFLTLLGAQPHLSAQGGCESQQWWLAMQTGSETESEVGLESSRPSQECAVCMTQLLPTPPAAPAPGKEPVSTVCGHAFHSECIMRWLATDEHPGGGTCPVCRRLQTESDIRPLRTNDEARQELSSNLMTLLNALTTTHGASDARDGGMGLGEGADADPDLESSPHAILGSAALAELALRRYAEEPRAAELLGGLRVQTSQGLCPLRDTLLSDSFSHLRGARVPLLEIVFAPRHRPLLSRLGCGTTQDLQGTLKALRLLVACHPASATYGIRTGSKPTHLHPHTLEPRHVAPQLCTLWPCTWVPITHLALHAGFRSHIWQRWGWRRRHLEPSVSRRRRALLARSCMRRRVAPVGARCCSVATALCCMPLIRGRGHTRRATAQQSRRCVEHSQSGHCCGVRLAMRLLLRLTTTGTRLAPRTPPMLQMPPMAISRPQRPLCAVGRRRLPACGKLIRSPPSLS